MLQIKTTVNETLLSGVLEEVAKRAGIADRSLAIKVIKLMNRQMGRGGRRSAYLQSQRDALRILENFGLPHTSRNLYVAVTNSYFTLLKASQERVRPAVFTRKKPWEVVRL